MRRIAPYEENSTRYEGRLAQPHAPGYDQLVQVRNKPIHELSCIQYPPLWDLRTNAGPPF
jgi:hypothetical protein